MFNTYLWYHILCKNSDILCSKEMIYMAKEKKSEKTLSEKKGKSAKSSKKEK